MSFTSTMAAAADLLTANVPELVTVMPKDEHGARVPKDECPALLMNVGAVDEQFVGFMLKEVTWWLEMDVWAHYDGENSLATTGDAFRDFINSIAQTLRSNLRMGGTADTATSQLLFANGEMKEPAYSRPQQGAGSIIRHAVLSTKVRELFRV